MLKVGDEVEFVVVTNQRTRKHSACCVRKLCTSRRPERLISKLKTMNLEEAARGGLKVLKDQVSFKLLSSHVLYLSGDGRPPA